MSDLVKREYHLRQYVGIPHDVLIWMEDAAAEIKRLQPYEKAWRDAIQRGALLEAERDALRALLREANPESLDWLERRDAALAEKGEKWNVT